MLQEFRARIMKKRGIIELMKMKAKELALKDTTIICERCRLDLAPLKTVDFLSEDLHFAKCVFGTFRKVEIEDALNDPKYAEDRDFVQLYIDINKDEAVKNDEKGLASQLFAFCECRKGHIVGIIKDQKYYLTDISQVLLMFPSSVYEAWDTRFWQPKYVQAFELEKKLNYQRVKNAQDRKVKIGKVKSEHQVIC